MQQRVLRGEHRRGRVADRRRPVDVLADLPEGRRYLIPDSCLSGGKFLDGMALGDLPRPVEVGAGRRGFAAPGARARPTWR